MFGTLQGLRDLTSKTGYRHSLSSKLSSYPHQYLSCATIANYSKIRQQLVDLGLIGQEIEIDFRANTSKTLSDDCPHEILDIRNLHGRHRGVQQLVDLRMYQPEVAMKNTALLKTPAFYTNMKSPG